MKILVTAEYDAECIEELEWLYGEVIYKPWTMIGKGLSEDEVINLLHAEKPNGFITELDDVSANVIEQFPNLKFIGDCRATPKNIDIVAAEKHKIPVLTTPGRNAQAVGELFVGCLLSFMRNIATSYTWVKEGRWIEPPPHSYFKFQGYELSGKTVGIVGFGGIGQSIAKLLRGFDCEILYHDAFIDMNFEQYQSVDLETIATNSDIVSINLPVNDSTRGLIDKSFIGKMKSDAIFVNTARSAVVDMDALYDSLVHNKIRGAIIDVFDHEPPTKEEYKMIQLSNVFATPHIAGATFDVVRHQSKILNEALRRQNLTGGEIINLNQ